MSDAASWISAGANVIIASAACAGILNYFYEQRRNRKTNACKIIRDLTGCSNHKTMALKTLMENFDDVQIASVINRKEFNVSKKFNHFLETLFSDHEDQFMMMYDKDIITVTSCGARDINFHISTYLNSVETAVLYWNLNLVDKETIYKQLKPFISGQGHTIAKRYRDMRGGRDIWPSIYLFEDEMERRKNKTCCIFRLLKK